MASATEDYDDNELNCVVYFGIAYATYTHTFMTEHHVSYDAFVAEMAATNDTAKTAIPLPGILSEFEGVGVVFG